MATKDWKSFLFPYEQAVDELKVKFRAIRGEYRRNNEYSPIEFVTGRVKEVSSMLEKANKFQIPYTRLEYELEDISGIRIMCQFVDDIDKVVNIIRNRKDMQVLYEKDYIDNVKESGYRSYHIIIKYPVYMAHGVVNTITEIQIRTLAMNFWAVAEHSLNYKYKQSIPENIRVKLKEAAESAYQLDQIMLDIKDEIKDAQRLFEVKSSLISSIMDNIVMLSSMNKISESQRYQIQLNSLIESGDVTDFVSLYDSIRNEISKYKR